MRRFFSLRTALAVVTALGLSLFAIETARAQGGYLYGGPHPIHPQAGGGFCYTPDAHGHEYPIDPNIEYLYRNYNGYYHFAGNVYDFGYEGEAFPYYGHHPLPAIASYCYLDGLHYHHFLPPPAYATSYVVYNGYYYYRGVFPAAYYTWRRPYYRSRLGYWYLPAYRAHRARYAHARRAYARRASVTYIRRPPAIRYQPRGRVVHTVRTPARPAPRPTTTITRPRPTFDTVRRPAPTMRPAYRYNTQRPNTYNTHFRPSTPTRPYQAPIRPVTPVRPTQLQRPATTRPQPSRPALPSRPSQQGRTRTWRR